jgi:hypothetical protein
MPRAGHGLGERGRGELTALSVLTISGCSYFANAYSNASTACITSIMIATWVGQSHSASLSTTEVRRTKPRAIGCYLYPGPRLGLPVCCPLCRPIWPIQDPIFPLTDLSECSPPPLPQAASFLWAFLESVWLSPAFQHAAITFLQHDQPAFCNGNEAFAHTGFHQVAVQAIEIPAGRHAYTLIELVSRPSSA